MTLQRIGRKLLKITGVLLGFLLILLTVFHLWFISRAKTLLEDTVEKRSDGKLKLRIDKLRYNYFNHRMVIKNAVFLTTDSNTAPTAYRFAVKEIRLDLKALLPLVLHDQLLIDSLRLMSPDIKVTTLRLSKDSINRKSKDVSIPYEMGKVYNSIRDALEVLRVTRFQIDDGTFTLLNKAQPGQGPLRISNIRVEIDNLRVDTTVLAGKEKLLFSDNVVLHSHHQDFLFPDGRHRLAFSGFRINLKSQLVEFDSCTIAATRTDSALSSFHVFFDTLKLTRIDFDTLYRSEVIKADSVYCLNPKFELITESGKKKSGKRPGPQLEKIVQQLTGNLLLGFVIVENADFNIRNTRDGVPSSFTFSRNNFEMQGLSIDQDAEKPIKVKSFAMAIRNYENFIKDSSYSIQFDSVRFKDDQFILSNFLFHKLDRGRILNSFRVPRFFLEGLSWDDLVFERKLRAKSVVMIEPDINYNASADPRKKQGLFQSLGVVNEFMDLDQLEIVNGRIDLKLKKDLRVRLENASLSVQSQSLLSSTRLAGIKNSLNGLHFDKGIILAGNTTVEMNDIRYTGESGKFKAGTIRIYDSEKKLNAVFEETTVDKLVVDEENGNVVTEGIGWQKGDIAIPGTGGYENTAKSSSVIELKNIRGNNTNFSGTFNGNNVSARLKTIRLDELVNRPGSRILLKGFASDGEQLKLQTANLDLTVADYSMTDSAFSSLREVALKVNGQTIKAAISIPVITAVPQLLRLMNGELVLDAVNITHPFIHLEKTPPPSVTQGKMPVFPKMEIGAVTITAPRIHFTDQNDNGTLTLNWNEKGRPSGSLQVTGLVSSGKDNADLFMKTTGFQLADFTFTSRGGRSFTTGDGVAEGQIRDLSIKLKTAGSPDTAATGWKGDLSHLLLRDLRFDSIGKNKGRLFLASAKLADLQIGSATTGNIQQLARANSFFRIENSTGHYADANNLFAWSNAGFNRNSNILSLDSFSFRPALEKDSFLTTKRFQTDYIQAGSGSVKIGPVDFNALIIDRILDVKKISITDAYFSDYKDKNMPFNPGIIKPLPVEILKKIPLKLVADTVQFINGSVLYTELNEKTKRAGIIPVKRMTVLLHQVKNYNITATDSLEIYATGYILDTVWTKLRVKQSYLDTAGGFRMTVRMKPGDLTVLNSVLIPLASVKLLSGKLDTLDLRAVGREYLAMGEMKMYYEDLKIQVLEDGKEDKKTLRTRLLSFIANNLVIRNKNKSRTGEVFFIRHRDRSAINYLVQITFSGMASSTGAKNFNKQIRRYRKELREKGLPLFDKE